MPEQEAQPDSQRRVVSIPLPSYSPRFTYTIIGVTVFVYLLQVLTLRLLGLDIPAAFGAKVNDLIRAGQLWRLFTPMLLHDDQTLIHIGFNMYFLFIVGTRVERFTGHGRFLLLYILSGFAGCVISFVASPYSAWGASGALFGLLGYEAAMAYRNRSLLGATSNAMLKNALSVALINILIGFVVGADNWGHVGGLLGGLVFTWFAGPRWEVEGLYPDYRMQDKVETRDVIVGVSAVLIIFGVLTIIGMVA